MRHRVHFLQPSPPYLRMEGYHTAQLEAVMDLTPEELRRIEGRWKSDVDKKLDRLVRLADKHEPFIEELIRREKARAQFWEDMARHAAKVGIGSLVTSGIYAIWLGIKHAIRL